MSAAKAHKDNEYPDLLNQGMRFTEPNWLFTKWHVLLLLRLGFECARRRDATRRDGYGYACTYPYPYAYAYE